MSANKAPKEETPLEKGMVQTLYKLDTLFTELQWIKVAVKVLPQSNQALWLFSALNFVINCAVLIVLYANLHP